jgi:hypothetical protein
MGGEGEGGVSKHVQIRRGARKTAGAARGRQARRREEGSRGGARKAQRRREEGSRSVARKAAAAALMRGKSRGC